MVQQVTKGIKISVNSKFNGTFYKNLRLHFAFDYTVCIENHSSDSVQINRRYWTILDALNPKETVEGAGVIGRQPILEPGERHTYTSGCLLTSPFGAMKGFYTLHNFSTNTSFRVRIPIFKLSADFTLN